MSYKHRVKKDQLRLKQVSGGKRTRLKTLATRGRTFAAAKGEPFLHVEFLNEDDITTHTVEIPIAAIPESVVTEWLEIEEAS